LIEAVGAAEVSGKDPLSRKPFIRWHWELNSDHPDLTFQNLFDQKYSMIEKTNEPAYRRELHIL
jgi:hypothetical protein